MWGPAPARMSLVLYGFVSCTNVALYMYCITVLPLADAVCISFTSPVFNQLAAFFFLKEPLQQRDVVSALLCIIGVTLVVRPSFLGFPRPEGDAAVNPINYLLCLIGAAGNGPCFVIIRKNGAKENLHVHPFQYVFYLSLCGILVGIVGMFGFPAEIALIRDRTPLKIIAVLSIAVLGFLGQIFSTSALELAPRKALVEVSNLNYSQILLAFIWSAVFGLKSSIMSVIGAILISGTVLWSLFTHLWHFVGPFCQTHFFPHILLSSHFSSMYGQHTRANSHEEEGEHHGMGLLHDIFHKKEEKMILPSMSVHRKTVYMSTPHKDDILRMHAMSNNIAK